MDSVHSLEISPISLSGKKIWVAGHGGMVGSALCRRLMEENCDVLTVDRGVCDLRVQADVRAWYARHKPDMVIVAAAKVGGIKANSLFPADFIYDNLMIAGNVMHGAYEYGVERLLFLGSSCIYPRECPQPIMEEALLEGRLEPTNAPYAVAKIAAIKMIESYRTQYGSNFFAAMPCNLFGIGDHYDAQNSHVIPALIMKIHKAKLRNDPQVTIWGTGKAQREFMDVDDLADALVFYLRHGGRDAYLNIGSGMELSIADLVRIICEVVGYSGGIVFDPSQPDGTPRKILDSSRFYALGWQSKMCQKCGANVTGSVCSYIKDGIGACYRDFLKGEECGAITGNNTGDFIGRQGASAAAVK